MTTTEPAPPDRIRPVNSKSTKQQTDGYLDVQITKNERAIFFSSPHRQVKKTKKNKKAVQVDMNNITYDLIIRLIGDEISNLHFY